MKPIILCADDFGQNDAISQGIIELAARGRLSAISCMSNNPHWADHGATLKSFPKRAAIGLHFNLTHGTPLTAATSLRDGDQFLALPALLLKCWRRQIDPMDVVTELKAQLHQFQEVMAVQPDFVDGHQHIHQFPMIRDAVIDVYLQQLQQQPCYLRQVKMPYDLKRFFSKRWLINLTGARPWGQLLRHHQIPHNPGFAGVYDFKEQRNYRLLFHHFIKQIPAYGLIMCHPGLEDTDATDPIYRSRFKEYHYLASDTFLEDCEQLQIELVPYPDETQIA